MTYIPIGGDPVARRYGPWAGRGLLNSAWCGVDEVGQASGGCPCGTDGPLAVRGRPTGSRCTDQLELCGWRSPASRREGGGSPGCGTGEDHAGDIVDDAALDLDDDHDGAHGQDQREHVHSGSSDRASARDHDDDY